jgi:SAM-dependent methyltransferase
LFVRAAELEETSLNIRYIALRLLRHFMPEGLARFLLKRRWIIQPGLESSDPSAAVEQYIKTLSAYGGIIQGKRVLVFGYGGRFAVGVELLRRGAAHVILCDHFVLLDHERNRELLSAYDRYLELEQDQVQPRSEFITLLHGDIREEQIQRKISKADVILSTSVYEHLDDVDGITRALANVTAPDGVHLHFVDLRDHYFKYPFEMLKFSDGVWRNFLNPTSNLNRFRLGDYQRVFEAYFQTMEMVVLGHDLEAFRAARRAIRAEFLTGDEDMDAVTLISVFARQPK